MFEIDNDLEEVILKNPVDAEIYKLVRAAGFLNMKEDAMLKAFQGVIPFEEVNTL